jgi:hypothetical protein
MQPDDFRRWPGIEMALDSVPAHGPGGLHRFSLGEDGVSQRRGRKPALWRLFDKKNNFVHFMYTIHRRRLPFIKGEFLLPRRPPSA